MLYQVSEFDLPVLVVIGDAASDPLDNGVGESAHYGATIGYSFSLTGRLDCAGSGQNIKAAGVLQRAELAVYVSPRICHHAAEAAVQQQYHGVAVGILDYFAKLSCRNRGGLQGSCLSVCCR